MIGQSWGGMLAMEYALDHPPGLRGIVVADSPARMPLWVAEANRLRAELPADVQATLDAPRGGGHDRRRPSTRRRCGSSTPGTSAGVPVAGVRRAQLRPMEDDPTVYHTMNGPSEFHVIGSLASWDITDRLREIDVPTLLVSGRYDEATPLIVERDPRAHRRLAVGAVRGVEPHAARRGARALPRRRRRLPGPG